jgi:glycosyltransferase involved in cell wall biosynthesis
MLRHIDRERFDPFVVTLADTGDLRDAIHELAPIYTVQLTGKLFNRRGLRELWRLRGWLRTNRIDVVHLLMDWATVYGSIAARIARLGGIPTVASNRMTDFPPSMSPGLIRLYMFSLRHLSDHILPNSQSVADVLAKLRVEPRRMTVIHNGIPDHRLRPYSDPPDDSPLTICSVGRLRPEKGQRILVEAFALLRKRGYTARLVIVGSGTEEANVRRRAEELGVADDIEWTGYREQPMPDIERSHICVLPSLTEGFPNAVVEYMAGGRAVVSTDVGGVREIVTHGETGLLIPPGDPNAMVDAIAKLADDAVLRETLGRNARALVEAKFTARIETEQTCQIYEKVIGE